MSADLLPEFIRTHYEVHEWKHVCAILKQDFVNEWNDIVSVLNRVSLTDVWYLGFRNLCMWRMIDERS